MKIFGNEGEARQYLEKRVPPTEKVKDIDTRSLDESLFTVPEIVAPGHYEFEGKHGFKVSFDIEAADDTVTFNRCWLIYKNDDDIEGEYSPRFTIQNLQITTEHFSHTPKTLTMPVSITWLPNLRHKKIGNAATIAYSGMQRDIYLIGAVNGWFTRPDDLLGFFHELGHSETRPPDVQQKELSSVKTTISAAGVKTEPFKRAALELQRERDANAWMLRKTQALFEDLEIPRELIVDYTHHIQLESYHEMNRKRLAKDEKGDATSNRV